MNVTITDQAQCKKQLHLEIPGDRVRAETDKVAVQYGKQVNVPGFRRGHVPTSVMKTRFKKELRDEVLSRLVPDSLADAIKEKELKVIGQPNIDDMTFRDDETVDVTVTLEVAPEFELSNYKSLPTTKRVYKVSDEDVRTAINRLRERHAQLAPVEDRGAQPGDVVTASVTRSFVDGPVGSTQPSAEEPATQPESNPEDESQEVEIELGAKGVLKEFTQAFLEARPGERKEFNVEYPADYKPEQFSGKRVHYSAEVTAVRVKELPEPDDEFAQVAGEEFKTFDDLRQSIRSRLEHEATHKTEEELRSGLMEQLVDRNRFEVPEVAIEQQIDSRMRSLMRQLQAQGMDPRLLKLDVESLREAHRQRAIREVRGAFILERIAEAENIAVTDDEVQKELEPLAESLGQPVEAVKARLTKDGSLDRLREQVRNRKAVDLVIASADIRVEEVEGLGDKETADLTNQ